MFCWDNDIVVRCSKQMIHDNQHCLGGTLIIKKNKWCIFSRKMHWIFWVFVDDFWKILKKWCHHHVAPSLLSIVCYCDIQNSHGNMICPYQLQDQRAGVFNYEGGRQHVLLYILMLLVACNDTVILQLFWTWHPLNITILQVTDGSRVRVFVVGGLWCFEMLKQLLLEISCLKTTQSNGWPNEWGISLGEWIN